MRACILGNHIKMILKEGQLFLSVKIMFGRKCVGGGVIPNSLNAGIEKDKRSQCQS